MKVLMLIMMFVLSGCSSFFYKRDPIVLNPKACEVGLKESIKFYNDRCLSGQDRESAHYCDEMRKFILDLNTIEKCEANYNMKMKTWIQREMASDSWVSPTR